jgi:DNA modification methylase
MSDIHLPFGSILVGDAMERLAGLPDGSVQCCVTSPPYYSLRDYNVPGQIGLEPTPAAYVVRMVAVYAEVRRVLADDGTLWLNLGDSFANDGKWGGSSGGKHAKALHGNSGIGRQKVTTGAKPKDLLGIPWRVALALQADGWYLRSDIIWQKPNPMPESVTDRPTSSHEHIFLLAKSPSYYYDAAAIAEDADTANNRPSAGVRRTAPGSTPHGGPANGCRDYDTRNKRDVWTVPTSPLKAAHFATYPPELIRPCILAGCPVGGVVLDPFGGSGTTGMVSVQEGRRFLLIELNPDYAALAKRRVIGAQPPLLAALEEVAA